jgi:hypothetical protein
VESANRRIEADFAVLMSIVAEFNCAKGVRKTSGVKCSTKELKGKGSSSTGPRVSNYYRAVLKPLHSVYQMPRQKCHRHSDCSPNKRSQSFHCSANLPHNSALGMINRCLYDYRYVFRNKVRDSPSGLNRC